MEKAKSVFQIIDEFSERGEFFLAGHYTGIGKSAYIDTSHPDIDSDIGGGVARNLKALMDMEFAKRTMKETLSNVPKVDSCPPVNYQTTITDERKLSNFRLNNRGELI